MTLDTLSCEATVSKLLDYTSGELPEAEATHVDGHIAGCTNCAAFLRTYQAVPRMLTLAYDQLASDSAPDLLPNQRPSSADELDELAYQALSSEVGPELQAELDASVMARLAELRKLA